MAVNVDTTRLQCTERNVCVICGKEFKSKTELEVHFWDHTGDNFELQCMICGKEFLVREQLIEHIKSHTPNPDQPLSPTRPVFKLSKYTALNIKSLSTLSKMHYEFSFKLWSSTCKVLFSFLEVTPKKKPTSEPSESSKPDPSTSEPQPSTSGYVKPLSGNCKCFSLTQSH